MDIFGMIGSIFAPAAKLIDNLHTSEEEKLKLHTQINQVQHETTKAVLDYEKKLMTAQADIIKAEAAGQSWLQRNWRPITMLVFLILVVCDSFGWLKFRLADQAWTLLQIGLGGYVIGRSAEKISPAISKALHKQS